MPRPVPRFHRFVGQKPKVDLLRRQLDGARSWGEIFPPTLFTGPSGVGKTLLAESLAHEYGSKLHETNGHESLADFVGRFGGTQMGDFLFVDEAHRAASSVQELLYDVIDRCRVPNLNRTNDEGAGAGAYREIAPTTVILATDQPGKLLNALYKRAEIHIQLGFYSVREMRTIVDRMASDIDLLLSAQASSQIAKMAHGIPRIARHLLRNLRRHYANDNQRQLSVSEIREFANEFGFDKDGFQQRERDYLRHLARFRRSSLGSLSLALGLDEEYVQQQIEPILARAGLITIGPGGRRLTDEGQHWDELNHTLR